MCFSTFFYRIFRAESPGPFKKFVFAEVCLFSISLPWFFHVFVPLCFYILFRIHMMVILLE